MTIDQLIERLNDIEWEDFEVKEARSEVPKSVWETVSAFANTAGGWVIFGVRKHRKSFEVTGVKNPEKIEQDFTNTLRGDKFNIKIIPECRKYDLAEGTVLGFYIPLSDKKPVYYNNQANTFIRTASGDQRATKEEIDAMYRDQAFGTHTSKAVSGTSAINLNDQSYRQYREYLRQFNPSHPYNRLEKEEFLKKIRILSDGNLTYSGLLCLGDEDSVQKEIPNFRVDYLEIPGTSYTDAKTRYTYRIDELENLWEYFFAIFDRLRRHLDLPFQLTQEGFAAEDYPHLEALREALVNMLMHSDYFSAACPRVRVFDDRVEFFNPGTLPKPLEKLMEEDISIPRNPIVAKFFRIVKLAENAGYGFDKMINGWEEYTGTKPEFEKGLDYTKATFYFKSKGEVGSGKVREKFGKSSGKIRERFGKSPEQIIEFITQDKYITIPEMADKLGISSRAVEKHIATLREAGLIERIGSRREGYWKVNLKE